MTVGVSMKTRPCLERVSKDSLRRQSLVISKTRETGLRTQVKATDSVLVVL